MKFKTDFFEKRLAISPDDCKKIDAHLTQVAEILGKYIDLDFIVFNVEEDSPGCYLLDAGYKREDVGPY